MLSGLCGVRSGSVNLSLQSWKPLLKRWSRRGTELRNSSLLGTGEFKRVYGRALLEGLYWGSICALLFGGLGCVFRMQCFRIQLCWCFLSFVCLRRSRSAGGSSSGGLASVRVQDPTRKYVVGARGLRVEKFGLEFEFRRDVWGGDSGSIVVSGLGKLHVYGWRLRLPKHRAAKAYLFSPFRLRFLTYA